MGVFTYEKEITSSLPPERIHNAFVKKSHILLPQLIPPIQSFEFLEGNGGPGSIIKVVSLEDGKSKYGVRKVEEVDDEKFEYKYSLVEGDALPENVEKISVEDKLVEGPNGGSIAKIITKYHTKGDTAPSEHELNKARQKGDKVFRAVEAYLLANPDFN